MPDGVKDVFEAPALRVSTNNDEDGGAEKTGLPDGVKVGVESPALRVSVNNNEDDGAD